VDRTPPEVKCTETVNPHGRRIPPAGRTTLPGSRGGQNEDGFYEVVATDAVDPDPMVFVIDTGTGFLFGPFDSGIRMKYTEAPGATPGMKTIGSRRGQAAAVDLHIKGAGDAAVVAIDDAGNVSDLMPCLVPPPPK
jgi:hypothetical protein